MASDPAIDAGATPVSPMRIGMMIGDAQGSHESTTARVLFGLISTGFTNAERWISRGATITEEALVEAAPPGANGGSS